MRLTVLPLSFAALFCSCTVFQSPAHKPLAGAEALNAFGTDSSGPISVKQSQDRPVLALVSRNGDPRAALSVAVLTEGASAGSTILGSIMEQRLRKAGQTDAQVVSTRDGYRVQTLLDPSQGSVSAAILFIRRVREAMLAPIGSSTEFGNTKLRLESLRKRPLDSLTLAPIAACTGELGSSREERIPDLTSSEGLALVELWRQQSHGTPRIAIAFVGPQASSVAFEAALSREPAWPRSNPPEDPWPAAEHAGVYTLTGEGSGDPVLTVASRVRDPFAVAAIADRAGSLDGPLTSRLSAAPNWRVSRVSATVRPRGACLSVTLRRGKNSGLPIEADAARIAALVLHETETELAEARADGSVAGQQVLRASDPREAASLAAWWSLASQLPPGPDRSAVALGLPPPNLGAKDDAAMLDASVARSNAQFRSELQTARDAWHRGVLDAKSSVEAGQGEVWVLIASPCGTSTDTENDAGITAIAAIAAAHHRDRLTGVSVEPWVSQDGVGILAHAPAMVGEGPHALASRVADMAARAIRLPRLSESDVSVARARVLGLLDDPQGVWGSGFDVLAKQLAPAHPAWISPFGLHDSVVKSGAELASMRWASISDGPLRAAVIANVDAQQADAAVRAADRWMIHRSAQPRTCPPISPSLPRNQNGTLTVRSATGAHAWVGVAIGASDDQTEAWLDTLVEALNGPDGILANSISQLPRGSGNATARSVGGAIHRALVIDIDCQESATDDAIRVVKAALQKLQTDGLSEVQLVRAGRLNAQTQLKNRLDPRRRVVDLWKGKSNSVAAWTVDSAKGWLKLRLEDSKIQAVRVLTAEPSQQQ